jgi:manganese transport protein
MFTNDKIKMGEFVNGAMVKASAWIVAVFIALLNGWLLIQAFRDWL